MGAKVVTDDKKWVVVKVDPANGSHCGEANDGSSWGTDKVQSYLIDGETGASSLLTSKAAPTTAQASLTARAAAGNMFVSSGTPKYIFYKSNHDLGHEIANFWAPNYNWASCAYSGSTPNNCVGLDDLATLYYTKYGSNTGSYAFIQGSGISTYRSSGLIDFADTPSASLYAYFKYQTDSGAKTFFLLGNNFANHKTIFNTLASDSALKGSGGPFENYTWNNNDFKPASASAPGEAVWLFTRENPSSPASEVGVCLGAVVKESQSDQYYVYVTQGSYQNCGQIKGGTAPLGNENDWRVIPASRAVTDAEKTGLSSKPAASGGWQPAIIDRNNSDPSFAASGGYGAPMLIPIDESVVTANGITPLLSSQDLDHSFDGDTLKREQPTCHPAPDTAIQCTPAIPFTVLVNTAEGIKEYTINSPKTRNIGGRQLLDPLDYPITDGAKSSIGSFGYVKFTSTQTGKTYLMVPNLSFRGIFNGVDNSLSHFITGAGTTVVVPTTPEGGSGAGTPTGSHPTEVARFGGADRVDTALEVFKQFPAATKAVLATGRNYPDGLTATTLAAALQTGTLLTMATPGQPLEAKVLSALTKQGVKEVRIVGGSGVVPASVEDSLRAAGIKTVRHAGADRYATAKAVADATAAARGKQPTKYYLVAGSNFPDALTAGPVAALTNGVLVLAEKIDPALAKNLTPANTVCVGGPACRAYPTAGTKVVGADRYATARGLQPHYPKPNSQEAIVASGKNFPDALAAGPLAVAKREYLLLTDGESLTFPGGIGQINVVGGKGVIQLRKFYV